MSATQDVHAQAPPSSTFVPSVFDDQDTGGLTLAPGDTITVSDIPRPDQTQWRIDGVAGTPDGATLTIPAGLTVGEHEVEIKIVRVSPTDGSFRVEHFFKFTFAEPEPDPPISFVPSVLDNQAAGGLVLVPGSTITVSDLPLPDENPSIQWLIDGMAVLPNGPILTIPADIAPGEHEGVVFFLDSITRSSEGAITDQNQDSISFKFTIAPPDNEPDPVYTFDPLVFTNQVNGGLVLVPGSTITVTEPVGPNLVDQITWSIAGVAQPDGATLTIPADIAPGEHEGVVVVIGTFSLHDGTIFSSTTETMTFKFTIAPPDNEADPVYTFDPLVFSNQVNGGLVLVPGSTITVTEPVGPNLVDQITWSIAGVAQPDGATLTIPADIAPGEHEGVVVVIDTFALAHDGTIFSSTTETMTFKFTIAPPEPVYTFDPRIFENQGSGVGGPTLEPGDILTVTESTGSDLINLIEWSIAGIAQPSGPTLTIPADIMPGEHNGLVDAPLTIITVSPSVIDFGDSTMLNFKFTIAPPDNEADPVYTFDPLVFSNQVNGGLVLEPGSTITVTEPVGPNLVDVIEWSIAGVAHPVGATLTIPADIAPGEYEGQVVVINTFSLHDGTIFSSATETRTFKFTIAPPDNEPDPVYTFDPLVFTNQVNGGLTLEAGSTITVTDPTVAYLVDVIEWTINGVSTVGSTVTIPTGLMPGEHEGQIVVIGTFSLHDGMIFDSTTETRTFKFTIADPDNEPNPVYTFDPLVFTNQVNGGLTLEAGSTITVTDSSGQNFVDELTWTIDGAEQPDGDTLTIPADIAPGEYEVQVVVIGTYALEDDGTIFSSTTETRTFKFIIADPDNEPNPVYTFDPLVFTNQVNGGLTLEAGDIITVTEPTGSDLVDQITWTINGTEQPNGATLTIPADLAPGEYVGEAVVALTFTRLPDDTINILTTDPIRFTFTIAPSSSGGGNDWQKKPTFGKSYENTQFQVVENGFVFNGNTLNIIDNWHTEFLKTSSIIGDTNNVKIKVYTDKLLSSTTLQLGVPEIGKSSDAETGIHVMFDRNYTSVNDYDIMKIMHEQDEPLINTDETRVSIAPSHCTSDSVDMKCYTISFDFTIMAPLKHDVVAITATDNDRRSTITFINEGVEFLGDSLLESATHNIHQKLGNQAPSETITLTQQDRRYQVWEDADGYLWTQNDFNTFTQITHPDFVRYDDASSNVMTRINSAFDAMILDEQEKASLIFDSMTIQGTLDDSFTHVYPTGDKRDNMEILLLDEEARILALLG